MAFKVSFFNPDKGTSRRFFLRFIWDTANHRWAVSFRNDYIENPCIGYERRCPADVVKAYADKAAMIGEYVNIKRIPG